MDTPEPTVLLPEAGDHYLTWKSRLQNFDMDVKKIINIWIFMKVRFEYTKMTGRHQGSFFLSTLASKSLDSIHKMMNFWFYWFSIDISKHVCSIWSV